MQNASLPSGSGRTGTAETPDRFHERPILNSPYEYPGRHWELDEDNRPTNRVITNYHAFQPRETLALSAGGRALLQGRGAPLRTRESDGQA